MKAKNLIVSIGLVVTGVSVLGQKNNTININGTIRGIEMDEGTATIIPLSLGLDCMAYQFDSVRVSVTKNHFHFSGVMPYPYGFESIYFNGKTHFTISPFFLDAGNITITCFYDSTQPIPPEIKFSKTNEEYQNKFWPKFSSIQKILDLFIVQRDADKEEYNNQVPDSVKEKTRKIAVEYTVKRNAYLRQYIKENPHSFVPLAMLGQSVERLGPDIIEIEKTFSLLSPEMKNTVSGIKLQKAISLKKFKSISDSLKTFRLVDEKSNESIIDVYNSKYTLIDFWFSACKPCVAQFPQLSSIYRDFKDKGFDIVGVSTDGHEDDWKNAILKYNLGWKQLWDKDGIASNKLLIHSFPTNFLLDGTGKIVFMNIEPFQLNEFLKENISNKSN